MAAEDAKPLSPHAQSLAVAVARVQMTSSEIGRATGWKEASDELHRLAESLGSDKLERISQELLRRSIEILKAIPS